MNPTMFLEAITRYQDPVTKFCWQLRLGAKVQITFTDPASHPMTAYYADSDGLYIKVISDAGNLHLITHHSVKSIRILDPNPQETQPCPPSSEKP